MEKLGFLFSHTTPLSLPLFIEVRQEWIKSFETSTQHTTNPLSLPLFIEVRQEWSPLKQVLNTLTPVNYLNKWPQISAMTYLVYEKPSCVRFRLWPCAVHWDASPPGEKTNKQTNKTETNKLDDINMAINKHHISRWAKPVLWKWLWNVLWERAPPPLPPSPNTKNTTNEGRFHLNVDSPKGHLHSEKTLNARRGARQVSRALFLQVVHRSNWYPQSSFAFHTEGTFWVSVCL